MKMFSRITIALAIAVLAMAPAVSHADTMYNFSFATPGAIGGFSGTGTFDDAGGVITDLTGDFHLGALNEGAMTLIAPGGFAGNDNLFSPTAPDVDFAGFSFAAGEQDYNIFDYSGNQLAITQNYTSSPVLGVEGTSLINFSAVATPEPSSLFLLGTGILGLAGFVRRSRRLV